jgi:uridine kinase
MYPIILVAGGSCSGKTTFVKGFKHATVLSIDHFYKDITELTPKPDGTYNFDTPDAIDLATCKAAALALADGHDVTIPTYDYVTCKRTGTQTIAAPKNPDEVVVIEGLFTLCPPLSDIGVLRIYIEAPPDIRIARRIKRDIAKGRSTEETLTWFVAVEQGHQLYVEPSKHYANLIIPFSYSPIVFNE